MTKYELLIQEISKATDEGLTLGEAERAAALALGAMVELSEQLKASDKSRRLQKSGLKAVKAAIRLTEANKGIKKPTEGILDDLVSTNEVYKKAEDAYDESEVAQADLDRQFDICRESHLYFRGVSRGGSNG